MHASPRNNSAAVLVSIQLPGVTDAQAQESIAELTRLVGTLDASVVATLTQSRPNLRAPTVVGEGKLAELAALTGGSGEVASPVKRKPNKAQLRQLEAAAEDVGLMDDDLETDVENPDGAHSPEGAVQAGLIVFDCDLTPSQMQKIESATNAKVMDRTGVIIEIFLRHAHSRAAKLQVEMARLAYAAPRLRETGGERQGGGIGAKGAGESKLELDKRRIRDRQRELREQLEAVSKEDSSRRERRADEATVALVGYTNAGKSSMMRALTQSDVLVQDKLFATLDTTVRPMVPAAHPRILVSDTVGFIQNLPHDLVASFHSTLEEALHASLLLYVVDAADPAFRHQLEVTRTVLAQVGAGDIPSRLFLNKADCLDSATKEQLAVEFPDALIVSVLNPKDVDKIREHILGFFHAGMVEAELFLPYAHHAAVAPVRESMGIVKEAYSEEGTTLSVRANRDAIDRVLKKYPDVVEKQKAQSRSRKVR